MIFTDNNVKEPMSFEFQKIFYIVLFEKIVEIEMTYEPIAFWISPYLYLDHPP